MFTIARGALRLFVRHWPVLLAWYLFGHIAHHFLVAIAATAGSVSALGGLLLLPLAALARLAGFVGMFLALRPSLHGFNEMSREVSVSGLGYNARLAAGRGHWMLERPLRSSREFVQVMSATVLPFFAFYAAWRYLEDDLASYVSQAFQQTDITNGLGEVILNAGTNPLTVGVVLFAFAARLALNRLSGRLPHWTRLLSVYFEAVWVFLAANVLIRLVDGVPAWLESRSVVAWSEERLLELRSLFPPLGWLRDAASWAIAEFGALVFLPFAWLAIAAVLYGRAIALHAAATSGTPRPTARQRRTEAAAEARATAAGTAAAIAPGAGAGAASSDHAARPRPIAWLRTELMLALRQLRAEITPMLASARVVAGAGLAPFGVFVVLYTVIDGLAAWLTLGITRLVGANEMGWWQSYEFVLTLVVLAVAEPLRVVAVAASYDYCLYVLDARQDMQPGMTARERVEEVAGITVSEAAATDSREAPHSS